ncbi:ROK family protein [Agrobacterium vitis]
MSELPPWPQPITLTGAETEILRYVRQHPGKSRTEIALALQMSKAMLTKATGKFDEIGLVVERQDEAGDDRERGPRPSRITLAKDAFHTLGVYLDTARSAVVRSDIAGNVKKTKTNCADAWGEDLVQAMLTDIDVAIADSPAPLLGIGIAVPAIVAEDGELFEVAPSQRSLPLSQIAVEISETFKLPVYWDSGAHCVAYYEAHRPLAASECLFHLTMDYGVGGGLVWKGQLFRGASNQAANFGSLVPETGPRPSLVDLSRYLGEQLENLTLDHIEKLWTSGHAGLRDWTVERGKGLSMPLAAVVQLFNPDTILIGGFFPRSVLEGLMDQIDLGALDIPSRRPVTKPVMRLTDLVGAPGRAQAASLLPIAARLLGQKAISPPIGGVPNQAPKATNEIA